MMINVAGRYSAPTEAGRLANLEILNRTAAQVLQLGHVPVLGVNAALGIVACLPEPQRYDAMMKISLALAAQCDATLYLSPSPGADRELALAKQLGQTIYERIEDIPPAVADR